MKPIYAVILAGDSEDHKVQPGSVVTNKAFIPLNGRPMIDYTLDCYRKAPELAGIGIVGPQAGFEDLTDITLIPQRDSLVANVEAAAQVFPAGWLLFSSCDIPLITPGAISDFLSRCRGADMYYPFVAREVSEREFPEMQRTWVKLADGEYTGGNLLLIKSSLIALVSKPAAAFFQARKSPVQLASLIGVPTLLKLLVHRLTVTELEEKMNKILCIDCKAVLTPYPEIGADVDKKSDYDAISARLGKSSLGSV